MACVRVRTASEPSNIMAPVLSVYIQYSERDSAEVDGGGDGQSHEREPWEDVLCWLGCELPERALFARRGTMSSDERK